MFAHADMYFWMGNKLETNIHDWKKLLRQIAGHHEIDWSRCNNNDYWSVKHDYELMALLLEGITLCKHGEEIYNCPTCSWYTEEEPLRVAYHHDVIGLHSDTSYWDGQSDFDGMEWNTDDDYAEDDGGDELLLMYKVPVDYFLPWRNCWSVNLQ